MIDVIIMFLVVGLGLALVAAVLTHGRSRNDQPLLSFSSALLTVSAVLLAFIESGAAI